MTVEAAVFVASSEAPVATSSAVVVWFDYEKQTTVPIPDRLRERIRSFQVVPPAE